jgi:hypothetical protein
MSKIEAVPTESFDVTKKPGGRVNYGLELEPSAAQYAAGLRVRIKMERSVDDTPEARMGALDSMLDEARDWLERREADLQKMCQASLGYAGDGSNWSPSGRNVTPSLAYTTMPEEGSAPPAPQFGELPVAVPITLEPFKPAVSSDEDDDLPPPINL